MVASRAVGATLQCKSGRQCHKLFQEHIIWNHAGVHDKCVSLVQALISILPHLQEYKGFDVKTPHPTHYKQRGCLVHTIDHLQSWIDLRSGLGVIEQVDVRPMCLDHAETVFSLAQA